MRKHVPGLVFFVLIVALFAFGYSVVRNYRIPNIEPVSDPAWDSPRRDLYPVGEVRHVRVTQAIADPTAKSLAFSLSNLRGDVSKVEFTFYNVNAEGVRFVRDEVVDIHIDQWSSGTASVVIKYKTDWLGSKQIADNLYVVASVRSSELPSYTVVPFSRENGTAVLIAKH